MFSSPKFRNGDVNGAASGVIKGYIYYFHFFAGWEVLNFYRVLFLEDRFVFVLFDLFDLFSALIVLSVLFVGVFIPLVLTSLVPKRIATLHRLPFAVLLRVCFYFLYFFFFTTRTMHRSFPASCMSSACVLVD